MHSSFADGSAALPGLGLIGLCGSLLALKIFALGMFQRVQRARAGVVLNPEDAKNGLQVMTTEPVSVARARRAMQNDIENVPMFLLLGLIACLARASSLPLQICVLLFTAARFAHGFFYVRGVQPWRSISYGVGMLAMFGAIGLI